MKKVLTIFLLISLTFVSCNTGKLNAPKIAEPKVDSVEDYSENEAKSISESEDFVEQENSVDSENENKKDEKVVVSKEKPQNEIIPSIVLAKEDPKEKKQSQVTISPNSVMSQNSEKPIEEVEKEETEKNNVSVPRVSVKNANNAESADQKDDLESENLLKDAETPVAPPKELLLPEPTPIVDVEPTIQEKKATNAVATTPKAEATVAKNNSEDTKKATNAPSTTPKAEAIVAKNNLEDTKKATKVPATTPKAEATVAKNNSEDTKKTTNAPATTPKTEATVARNNSENTKKATNATATTPKTEATVARNNTATSTRTYSSPSVSELSLDTISTRKQNDDEDEEEEFDYLTAENIDAPSVAEALSKKEVPEEPKIEASRTVNIMLNQYLDVVYPGAGWVYLGEVDEKKNLVSFFSRNLENSDTSFILRGKTSGTTMLHFYKQDVLTGTYIDDYLEVVVSNEVYKGKEHCIAPDYANIVPPNQQKYIAQGQNSNSSWEKKTAIPQGLSGRNTESETEIEEDTNDESVESSDVSSDSKKVVGKSTGSSMSNTIQIDESGPQGYSTKPPVNMGGKSTTSSSSSKKTTVNTANMSASQLLEAAKKAYNEEDMSNSLVYLDSFFEKATSRIDEGLYLKGQLYESIKSDFRNIKTALESYTELTENYPSSSLWKKANNRITYINRFYFKIR